MSLSSQSGRIALGTAQFGLSYGIANTAGQVQRDEVGAILALASARAIDTLDTAVAYGRSEQVLGDAGVQGWRVISKLPALPDHCPDVAGWVAVQVSDILKRLRIDRLHGLLLHRPDQLLDSNGKALYDALLAQRACGRVEKIGVSIYGPEELDRLFERMRFDIVQSPFNVIDDRLTQSGWMDRLHASGCELHVRSVFLQGLLLMDNKSRPTQFDRWQTLWDQWQRWLLDSGLTALQACLRHALSIPQIARVVVGVDSLAQFEQILEAADGELPALPIGLKSHDPDLINPGRWVRA